MNQIKRYRIFLRIILLILAFLCIQGAVLERRARRECQFVMRWPRTVAVVLSGTPRWSRTSWGGTRFCPDMQYIYRVDTTTYVGRNELFNFGCHPDGYDFVAANRRGSQITIAYDPQKPTATFIPEDSTIPSWPWLDMIVGLALVFLVVADIVGLWAKDLEETYELQSEPEDISILGLK